MSGFSWRNVGRTTSNGVESSFASSATKGEVGSLESPPAAARLLAFSARCLRKAIRSPIAALVELTTADVMVRATAREAIEDASLANCVFVATSTSTDTVTVSDAVNAARIAFKMEG